MGFAYPSATGTAKEQKTIRYSFRNVRAGSLFAAKQLSKEPAVPTCSSRATVALLSSSTPGFLFTWLGLIRLGFAVLLIAPQNQPDAIVHLCEACNVTLLVHDDLYKTLAETSSQRASVANSKELTLLEIPFSVAEDDFLATLSAHNPHWEDSTSLGPETIAYLFHSSGTSSGLPRPIPQTHHGAVEVLPSFDNGGRRSTYSTTPLYHGGISDLFRAWSSNALIWLFPGKAEGSSDKALPLTAPNILSCFTSIEQECGEAPSIKYFTSVPYILQMMAADTKGLEKLKSMDCVGVGGAALPEQVGNELVDRGVNLVSRYGSAECGFLLSSHRNYEQDKAWQYLRADIGMEHLEFEPRERQKYEVVVRPGWPHLSKTNREDGSYATADLMTKHSTIPHAWRYDSRADSQLTLITGRKFDPAPLEDSIASGPWLDDVLIFGNGQPFPGALLFRSKKARTFSDIDLIAAVAPHIERLNAESQSHARIPRNMLVPMAYGDTKLQKSSKGTLLRNKAEETYADLMATTYERLSSPVATAVSDSDVRKAVYKAVAAIISNGHIGYGDDLFAHGVDSLGSIQIRYALQRLLPHGHADVPVTIVEDCATVSNLSDFVLRQRRGEKSDHADGDHAEVSLMLKMVENHSKRFAARSSRSTQSPLGTNTSSSKFILLTGATGALGAHLLSHYLSNPSIAKVYCLVRGSDAHAATTRVQEALASRKLPLLPESDSNAVVLPCKLGEPDLGLSADQHELLKNEVTEIIHAAWSVNFRWRLASFEHDHIAGTRRLLDLYLSSNNRRLGSFIFCSSIASVSSTTPTGDHPAQAPNQVPETGSSNPEDASPLGYSRSKWVTETILANAQKARPDANIQVLRIGQLSGDSVHGIWNNSEAWPLMLGSMTATGCLPDLAEQSLDWLAIDLAAQAVIESTSSLAANVGDPSRDREQIDVRHILNPDHSAQWSDALLWLKYLGEEFQIVPPSEWIRRLEQLEEEGSEHPALRLLPMWKQRYGDKEGEERVQARDMRFDIKKAEQAAPVLREVQPVNKEYFGKLWAWIKENATR